MILLTKPELQSTTELCPLRNIGLAASDVIIFSMSSGAASYARDRETGIAIKRNSVGLRTATNGDQAKIWTGFVPLLLLLLSMTSSLALHPKR